ncbi:hypothetical protein D3C80_1787050 [compost metagenome]
MGDDIQHREAVTGRVAQVQVRQLHQVIGELRQQRLVQPILLAQQRGGLLVGGARFGHQGIDGITGHGVQQDEVQHYDPEHGGQRPTKNMQRDHRAKTPC